MVLISKGKKRYWKEIDQGASTVCCLYGFLALSFSLPKGTHEPYSRGMNASTLVQISLVVILVVCSVMPFCYLSIENSKRRENGR